MKPVGTLIVVSLVFWGSPAPTRPQGDRPGQVIRQLVPAELIEQANAGRKVFRSDGYFALPEGVRRVWVDVGAHHLNTTHSALDEADRALIAIEPLAECWEQWPPDRTRIIGMPVAIDLETGWRDFHVNAHPATSSLAKSLPSGTEVDALTKLAEVRSVPVIRLADVLRAIPPEVTIEFVKTDVQGLDLQVLKSAGKELRRAHLVKTEIINARLYEGEGDRAPGTESEFVEYMDKMGFAFVKDVDIAANRSWLDKIFVNTALVPEGPAGLEEDWAELLEGAHAGRREPR